MTYRLAASLDFGLHRVRRLDATAPLPKLVSALNAFQPHWLHAYSSLAALLAREQVEGRLRIAPRTVSTSSELRTPEMERAMVEAWGTRPFDCYGITEVGIFGSDCPEHRGIHAFEDALIFEVVDEHRRPVPAGEQGRMLLLTNLYNRTQPLIRYEVTDMITAVAEQCPCGRPFRLVGKVAGRCDDILELPDGRGGHVEVHPIALRAALGAVPEVREYQVLQLAEAIDVRVVASPEVAGEALATRVRNALREGLARSGAEPPQLRIEFADRIDRDPAEMGKLKLVRSKPGRPAS
jgi:phenylacetate-coenzyme A ligase PaaK-like adenylate-forming protein